MKDIEIESQIDFRDFSFTNSKYWILDSFKLFMKNPFAILLVILLQYITMSYFVHFSVSLFTLSILLIIPLMSFFIFKSIDYGNFNFNDLKTFHLTVPKNTYIILLIFFGYEIYTLTQPSVNDLFLDTNNESPINKHMFILTFSFYAALFMTYIFSCNPFKLFVTLFPVQADIYKIDDKQKLKYFIIETQSFYDTVFWQLFKNIAPIYFIVCIAVFYIAMSNPMITFLIFSIFNVIVSGYVYFCIKDHLNLGSLETK